MFSSTVSELVFLVCFEAESLGLPLVPPSLGSETNVHVTELGEGVNFAVAGATALDSSFHEARGVSIPTNASLGVQLGWFKDSLSSICSAVSGN